MRSALYADRRRLPSVACRGLLRACDAACRGRLPCILDMAARRRLLDVYALDAALADSLLNDYRYVACWLSSPSPSHGAPFPPGCAVRVPGGRNMALQRRRTGRADEGQEEPARDLETPRRDSQRWRRNWNRRRRCWISARSGSGSWWQRTSIDGARRSLKRAREKGSSRGRRVAGARSRGARAGRREAGAADGDGERSPLGKDAEGRPRVGEPG